MKRLIALFFILALSYCGGSTTSPLDSGVEEADVSQEAGEDSIVPPDSQETTGDDTVSTDTGGEDVVENPLVVDTSVSSNDIDAGDSVTVTCTVSGGDSAEKQYETEVFLDKTEGVTQQDSVLTFTKTGKFLAGCRINGTQTTDPTPEEINVNPGPPVKLVLSPLPDKEFYKPFDHIKIIHQVLDQYSNEVFDATLLPYEVEPGEGWIWKESDPDTFIPQTDGFFKISTAVAEYPEVDASLELAVDSTPPLIVITTPHRGATLAGGKSVKVKGTVTDEVSKVSSFSINGKNS
ncbi:MAG: hypothetical protein FJ088_16150, partial [Deltaproteobacteria bacterium]|nr:hypothetical protein [Deltaproteobacteria bacterium]